MELDIFYLGKYSILTPFTLPVFDRHPGLHFIPSGLRLLTPFMKKVALVACMRKLLTILNAMIKHDKPWKYVEVDVAKPA